MTDVAITGCGMTRFGKYPQRSLRDLAEEAVGAALRDAAIDAGQVDAVFVSNSVAGIVTGQESVRGQTAVRGLGLMGKPIFNVENASASGSSAAGLGAASWRPRAVRVLGSAMSSGNPYADHGDHHPGVERAAVAAYEQAGVAPADVDVAEVHDAAAPAELESYESLGFTAEG